MKLKIKLKRFVIDLYPTPLSNPGYCITGKVMNAENEADLRDHVDKVWGKSSRYDIKSIDGEPIKKPKKSKK